MSVLSVLRKGMDRLVGGRGDQSITVPVMDGALKPNDRLERAASVALIDDADNLVAAAGHRFCTSGNQLLSLDADSSSTAVLQTETPISCLAASRSGALAIGLDGGGIRIRGGRHDGAVFGEISCPTDAVFLDEDRLAVANGSACFKASEWRHDLLHRGSTGSVVIIDLTKRSTQTIADRLAWPSGLCLDRAAKDALLVSEAWRHRIVRLDMAGSVTEVLGNLPAYPGRLAPCSGEGYWLACFSVRSQLQEFVLREERYRRHMIAEVPPDFWIAPSLSSGKSFKEPLQAGGVIRLGVHKPWAPTRSYGLVIRLDAQCQPAWSLHSRASGVRHGVTSLAEADGRLLVASKGRGEILGIEHLDLAEPDDVLADGDAA
ncbi:MAG: hypothetical protein AB7S80_01000 [Rhizobiaceae bacterium]